MNDAPGYRDWRIGTHRAVAEPCGALRLTYAVSGPRPQPPPGRLTALRGCSLANDWRTPPVASPQSSARPSPWTGQPDYCFSSKAVVQLDRQRLRLPLALLQLGLR